MQTLKITKGELVRTVYVPSSKSYANRALIICSLLPNSPGLKNLPDATDVTMLLNCLKAVGLRFEMKDGSLSFTNSFPQCEQGNRSVEVGEGGTTARFLAAMLLLGKNRYELILGRRLKQRPWQEFIDLVRSLGAFADLHDNVLTLQGPLKLLEELSIDCTRTTQFASAFHLLGLYSKCRVIPVNLQSSKSYWAMTDKLLNEIPAAQIFEIPLDWSSASYPMAFAALNHRIEFPGLKPDPLQADSKFYELLRSFDCVVEEEGKLIINPILREHEVIMDVSDCLDLVPTLAYLLSHIQGTHSLTGVKNLVHKESDRLNEVKKLLKAFGKESSSDGDKLVIYGSSKRISSEIKLEMPDDHRMVMVGTLFLLTHSGGEISPCEAVNKSYPQFFHLLSS